MGKTNELDFPEPLGPMTEVKYVSPKSKTWRPLYDLKSACTRSQYLSSLPIVDSRRRSILKSSSRMSLPILLRKELKPADKLDTKTSSVWLENEKMVVPRRT